MYPLAATKARCAEQCQAKCCRDKFVWLMEEEASRLQPQSARVIQGTNGQWMMMFLGGQCDFLNGQSECTIYKTRPRGCRDFPTMPHAYCLLWPTKEPA